MSPKQVERIVREYLRGRSTADIGRQYGVSAQSISRILHSKGIRPEGKKRWKYA